jgi:hypothetical protein
MDLLASQILREYQWAMDELIYRELLRDANSLIPFENQHRTVLSWSARAHLSYLFGEYSTMGHYCEILNRRDFCLCFRDGGLVQIKYDIEDDVIVSHRLCYFPCPFSFTSEDSEGLALSELPLLFSAKELQMRIKLASPIRFDFDAEMVDDRHAYSHVSINKESCRLPAYGPVSFGHFLRFVLRYFYETEFASFDEWAELKPRLYQRTLPYPPPHEFHLETESSY